MVRSTKNPPVGTRQFVEDGAVEHEDAPDLAASAQRVAQGRVVGAAKIAPEPHQAGIVLGRMACHGAA